MNLGVTDIADLGDGASTGEQGREPGERSERGAHRRPGFAEVAGEHAEDELDDRETDQFDEPQREPGSRGQREHRAQTVTGTQQLVVEIWSPDLDLLAVAHARCGRDHHAGPADVRSPAEVDVLAVERHRGVEATEGTEQVGAGEEACRRHREHVGDRIVLLLVVLARFVPRRRLTEPVDVDADVLEDVRVVPAHELGTDDAGVRAVELLDHQANGVGRQCHVVVAEAEEPVVTLDELEDGVGGGAESGVRPESLDVRVGEPLADVRSHVDFGPVPREQEERVQVGVVLTDQRLDRLVEPRTWRVHDHHRHDWRREAVPGSVPAGREADIRANRGYRHIANGCRHQVDKIVTHSSCAGVWRRFGSRDDTVAGS